MVRGNPPTLGEALGEECVMFLVELRGHPRAPLFSVRSARFQQVGTDSHESPSL